MCVSPFSSFSSFRHQTEDHRTTWEWVQLNTLLSSCSLKKLPLSINSIWISFLSDHIVIISWVILVGLFSLQHYGTHKVAFMFAPIVTAWLLCLTGIGVYNIFRWTSHIFHALSPIYMLKFLKSTGVEGWVSLGGVVLAITGNSFTLRIWLLPCICSKKNYWNYF